MKTSQLVWILFFIFLLSMPLAFADLDPNRMVGQIRLDGSWAPAGTLINITAGGATVQVTVDDGINVVPVEFGIGHDIDAVINVVPVEFGIGKFKTDPNVPYWDTGDAYVVKHATGAYYGQATGNLIAGTTNIGILDLYAYIGAPIIYARLHQDNHSVDLNWTAITFAESYTLYYSSNLTKIENLNISASLPAGVFNTSGLTSTQYNDTTANLTQKRYYRVAAVRGSAKNLSLNAVGKYTHTLIASANGILGRNLVAEPINASLNAKTYLQAIPTTLNPSVSKLDRSDPEDENWVSQVVGLPASLFDIQKEAGYLTFVNVTYNYTFVGPVWTNLLNNYLIASSDGVLGRNLIGVTYTRTGYDAKSYLAAIPTTLNPSVSRLDRTDPEDENWVSQVVGLPASLFNVYEAEGYLTFVNTSYNYSLS